MTTPSKLNLLELQNVPIFEQLRIEEALLRLNDENWCILNQGSPPSIVMGISGKPETLVNTTKLEEKPIPLIKRYSGGGTVVVDHNTLFASLIFEKKVHDFPCYPEPILRWSESLYQKALDIPGFHLRENDYVIGEHKCAGNAQYIKKERFVHHTTFLWDYETSAMDYLLYPPKTPNYRDGRSHDAFLCRLKEFLPSKEVFFNRLKETLADDYDLEVATLNPLLPLLGKPHRQTTSIEKALRQ
ncbi:lipoate--protein ligase family protein [Candidatus Neptunochlamydia vexilliferae]|nr:lipoate--protein ligase family protein [Candidatus Neptunochlamydia vexilliferae]